MYILYALCGLFAILGVVMLTGRGTGLIAGYNTMSESERARYDAPKLCRTIGVFLLVLVFFLLGLAMGWMPIYAFLTVVFLAVPVLLIYANTRCYRNPAPAESAVLQDAAMFMNGPLPDEEMQKRRKDFLVILVITGLLMMLFATVTIMLFKGSQPPTYTLVDGTLEITSQYGTRIPLGDIRKVERLDILPALLAKKNGFDMDKVRKGRFQTAEGDAILFVDLGKPPFLRLTTTSDVFILNEETPEKTEALYQALLAALP